MPRASCESSVALLPQYSPHRLALDPCYNTKHDHAVLGRSTESSGYTLYMASAPFG
jgi:hypothetical protein